MSTLMGNHLFKVGPFLCLRLNLRLWSPGEVGKVTLKFFFPPYIHQTGNDYG